jgi:hypothetical protein
MNIIAGAIVVGAAIIGGSVVWAGQTIGRGSTCAGYISSERGGSVALFVVSSVMADNPRTTEAVREQVAAFQLAGCSIMAR